MKLFDPMKLLSAAAFFTLLACVGTANGAEESEGPYPVWWEPVIEYADEFGFTLEKLEDAEKLIAAPFSHGLWVARKDEAEEDGYEIHDCATYRRLSEQGDHKIYVGVGYEYLEVRYLLGSTGGFCQVLEQLSNVVPAKMSFVRNFIFDENALDYLPAFVDVTVVCGHTCRQNYANEDRIPLRRTLGNDYEEIRIIDQSQIDMTYTEDGTIYLTKIRLIARGDFNHDGLEDLLIHSESKMYRTAASSLYVVTRGTPKAVLYVVDPERHVCPMRSEYICDPTEDDISNWRDAR